jgi:hypothetical protein
VLGFFTALLTLATAGLGLFAASATSEREDVQAEADQLSNNFDVITRERDDLSMELKAAREQITELRQQLADEPSTTTTGNLTGTGGAESSPADDALLSDLEPVVGEGWDAARDLNVDGTSYTHGIESSHIGYCGSNAPGIERTVEYSIDRAYGRFEAVAGLSEESAPDLPVKLEVFGDGRPLWSQTLLVGRPQPIDIDVTGILRLRLVATKQFDDPGGCHSVYAALGEPSLRT